MTAIATRYDAYPTKAEQYKQDLIANAGGTIQTLKREKKLRE